VGIDHPDRLFCLPGSGHLAVRIAGAKKPDELLPAMVVDTLVCLGEQSSTTIERVVGAAAVAERGVLHPAAALVELGVGQFRQERE
jgi:hypothetical protein